MKDKLIKEMMINLLTGHYVATKGKFISKLKISMNLTQFLGFTECHKEILKTYLLAGHGPKTVSDSILFLINGYSVHSFFEIEYEMRQSFILKCMNMGINTTKKGYTYKQPIKTSRGLFMLENIAQNFHEYLSPVDW